MGKFIDETGNCYGRLTVLSRAENDRYNNARWLCRCECGNEVVTSGVSLRSGRTKSCGCLRQGGNNELPEGEAAFNALVGSMKRSAKKRGHRWDLTREQIRYLTKQPCHYCGAKPTQCFASRYKTTGDYIYNGLDRVDNKRGYTIDNVVPCCEQCNRAKSAMTVEEFRVWVFKLYKHFTGGG